MTETELAILCRPAVEPMATGTAIRALLAGLPVPVLQPRIFIYGLTDPATGAIRYIGKSVRPAERFQNHLNERSSCHRSHWLQSLKRRGLTPGFVLLEIIEGSGWPWQAAERYWIARARANGWELTNNTSGGDGVPDLPEETRARLDATWKGRKHRPETIEKLKAARAQRGPTQPITRARMSAARRGRAILWKDKIGLANRKISAEQVSGIRARIESGERVQDLAAEFHVHRTTISKIKKGAYPD